MTSREPRSRTRRRSEGKQGLRDFSGRSSFLLRRPARLRPIVLHGPFCGDDFEFHIVSWFDVQQSWQHGIAIPHWMQSVNYGAGEPRFMFYPPLTWMLGAALGSVLPWSLVPVAMIFLFLVVTGFAVRALALEVLPDAAATLAGLLRASLRLCAVQRV